MVRTTASLGMLFLTGSLAAQSGPPVWKWEFPQIEQVVKKIRAGREVAPAKWPNGGRVAVALSFDMDAETGFLRSGNLTPQPLSRQRDGCSTVSRVSPDRHPEMHLP